MEELREDVWEKLARLRLTRDQTSALIEVDRNETDGFYIPLAATLLDRLSPPARLLVGIAGPPGCGKTAFAAVLAETINAVAGTQMAACLGLDGWHFSNAYLDSHFIERGGERSLLGRIKGAPET
jgi:pantothenate kinase